jgi:lyso-ornithine lipid O-acyltransferase
MIGDAGVEERIGVSCVNGTTGGVDGFMSKRIAAGLRAGLFLLWIALVVPIQMLMLAIGRGRYWAPPLFHRVCAMIVGMKIVVRGRRCDDRPVLFVANHSSYLDITILGALIPGSFVAKSEVAGWPLFGFLAKLQQTVFIERRNRASAGKQADDLRSRLESGDNLILFPEGTSSDGNRTLPFKTALFAVASLKIGEKPLMVQPVSITATMLDGVPMGLIGRPFYAWYGDMDLAPHLWQAFGAGLMTVEVEFHPPVSMENFASRKALADHCWREVAGGVSRAVSGRSGAGGCPRGFAAAEG